MLSTVSFLTGRCFPLRVGEVQLDERGRICPRNNGEPLRLHFAYRGVEFEAEVETDPEPCVRLTAELGKLPFSMEIGDGRRAVRRIVAASKCASHGRIDLSKFDDMRLEAGASPPTPLTPASIMATLAALMLNFQPYLDLLAQILDGSRRNKATPD